LTAEHPKNIDNIS